MTLLCALWHGAATAGLAFTDWLDGYIAKNYDQTSIVGKFLDPMADKALVAALEARLEALETAAARFVRHYQSMNLAHGVGPRRRRGVHVSHRVGPRRVAPGVVHASRVARLLRFCQVRYLERIHGDFLKGRDCVQGLDIQ